MHELGRLFLVYFTLFSLTYVNCKVNPNSAHSNQTKLTRKKFEEERKELL